VLLRRQVVVFLFFVFVEIIVVEVVFGVIAVFLDHFFVSHFLIVDVVVEVVVIVEIVVIVVDVVFVISRTEDVVIATGDGSQATSEGPVEGRGRKRHWTVGHVDILRVNGGITIGGSGRLVTR
jgi:hypothetical protein